MAPVLAIADGPAGYGGYGAPPPPPLGGMPGYGAPAGYGMPAPGMGYEQHQGMGYEQQAYGGACLRAGLYPPSLTPPSSSSSSVLIPHSNSHAS